MNPKTAVVCDWTAEPGKTTRLVKDANDPVSSKDIANIDGMKNAGCIFSCFTHTHSCCVPVSKNILRTTGPPGWVYEECEQNHTQSELTVIFLTV